MIWYHIIGIISAAVLFLPIAVILVRRLYRYTHYQALLIYCILAFVNILVTENIIRFSAEYKKILGVFNNLLDVPLMMIFLMLYSASKKQSIQMRVLLALYICYEIIIVYFKGLNREAVTLTLGPGIVIIFGITLHFFVRKVKQSLMQSKAAGKAVMITSLCFAYGCFGCIYIMHYILAIQDIPNLLLIFYMVSIIYSSVLSAGLIIESRRIKKLEEAWNTRRELKEFFADEKKPVTRKKVTGPEWEWN
jgi:hypothetical protein